MTPSEMADRIIERALDEIEERKMDHQARPFVEPARAQTMLRDFERLRQAIRRDHDILAAEAALDRCERWIDQLRPNS